MTRRSLIAAPALLCAHAKAQPDRPPNIVFLYTDDQGQWAAGAYGNKDVHSPNLDRIAAEGATFERAFVTTPVCSPSRAAMMTSQPSIRTGIRDYIAPSEPGVGLSPHFPTWPQLLRERGYRTALFGKWHLGGKPEHHPKARSFDEFLGFTGGGNQPMDPRLEVDGKEQVVRGSLPDILVDGAIDFVKRNRNQPFLASVHFRAPHMPYAPVPPQDAAAVAGRTPKVPTFPGLDPAEAVKQTLAYYASVASVDRNVGRMLAALDSLDLARNTIVVFTSDNGYMIGQHGAHGKGNAGGMVPGLPRVQNLFDLSMLVPMMLRWPGVVKPGTRVREMITHLDVFPFIANACGAARYVPDGYQPCGRDFAPLLRGRRIPWRETVFGDYDMHHNREDSMRMIRTGEWKLVTHTFAGASPELYNLKDDPGEMHNLIAEPGHAARLGDLRRRLRAWQEWIGDPRREA